MPSQGTHGNCFVVLFGLRQISTSLWVQPNETQIQACSCRWGFAPRRKALSDSQARLFPTKMLVSVTVALGPWSHSLAPRSQPAAALRRRRHCTAARQAAGRPRARRDGTGKAELIPRCRGRRGSSPSWDECPHGRHAAPRTRQAHPHRRRRRHQARSGNVREDGQQLDAQPPSARIPAPLSVSPVAAAESSGPPAHPGWAAPRGSDAALAGKGPVWQPGSASGLGGSQHPLGGTLGTAPRPSPSPGRRLRRTSRREQGRALAAALADTLWAAGGGGRAAICLLTPDLHLTPGGDYRPDNLTERVSTKMSSPNRVFFKDTSGLKFLKTRNIKSHKPHS